MRSCILNSIVLSLNYFDAAEMRLSESRARSTFGRLFPEGLKKLVGAMSSVKGYG